MLRDLKMYLPPSSSIKVTTAEMRPIELVKALREWHGATDPEMAHAAADRLLLAYINNPDVTEAFDAIEKWYS